ncbi:hypothetical protein [Salinigranum salinum]|uniref:hypothetical protein n=1 Tax=Salinigranum salinum TaxID=1364937 RepID=UPI0012611EF8|nr:hypothetical protein [Salinigranum salinum]
MTLSTDVRHGLRIASAEFSRSLRGYTSDTRRVLGIALFTLLFGGNLLFALPGIYLLGQRVQTVSRVPFLDQIALLLPVGLLFVAVLRTLERIGGAESEDLLLTTVHPRAVVVGLMTAEIARLALWFGLPVLLVSTVFAAGLGAPTLVVTAGLVSLPLVCCTAVWGYALGLGLLRVIRRLPTLQRALKIGGIGLLVVFVVVSQFVGQYLSNGAVSIQTLLSVVQFGPLTEYTTLAFVGTPLVQPVDPSALVVLVGCLVLTPLGLAVSERQATALWFTDSAAQRKPETRLSESSSETGRFTPPRPFSWRKSGRIAWGYLVRAARKPQQLVHLVLIIFFIGPFGTALFQSTGDGLLASIAGLGVVLGVYVSGAAFNLNPLGDDRDQLPLILLTDTDTTTHLRGRVGAGLSIGLPLAVLTSVGSLALSSSPLYGLAFAVAALGWCVAGALLALGLGCAYPVYEEREMWGVETVSPSTLVLVTYSVIVVFGTGLGLVVLWFLLTGGLVPSVSVLTGVSLYVLVTSGVPVVSYLYAVRRYRRHTIE